MGEPFRVSWIGAFRIFKRNRGYKEDEADRVGSIALRKGVGWFFGYPHSAFLPQTAEIFETELSP